MERVVEENKGQYYLSLENAQSVDQKQSDELVNWIIFFLECLTKQKNTLQIKLEEEKALISCRNS